MSIEPDEFIDLQISTTPWEEVDVDAFVCPTNSRGKMSTYPASKLKELAGRHVEASVQQHTPLAIGAAVITDAGNMRARHLIHVPNTDEPGGKVQVEDVLRATSAVLVAATKKGFSSLAFPLMGAFDAGIPAEEAARAIYSELRTFRGSRGMRAYLMAKDADEVEIFELAIEGAG